MPHDQPFYRSTPGGLFDGYPPRLLLGWAASLGVVVLLFSVPLPGADQVGWGPARSVERIALTEVASEPEASEATTEEAAPSGAPPVTEHAPPEPEAPSPSPAPAADEGGDASARPGPDTTATLPSLAALATRDQLPQILGGPGALLLHIRYPSAARKKGIEGRLKLSFTVDTSGWARDIEITDSLHPLCDSAAVDALQSVRFQPGTHKGDPVPVRMNLPIRFQLQSSPDAPVRSRSTASRSP
jgi:TonB family protein